MNAAASAPYDTDLLPQEMDRRVVVWVTRWGGVQEMVGHLLWADRYVLVQWDGRRHRLEYGEDAWESEVQALGHASCLVDRIRRDKKSSLTPP